MTGTVFNIQPYSLHDGPGIRTNVFLKGCPLRCIWCSNPESQKSEPQLYFDKSKCIKDKNCNLCGGLCERVLATDGDKKYADICPSGAIGIYGREMSVDEILDRVESESAFYTHGDGGMTLSGGEPFMQGDFALALLREAKRRCIHTAVETCGFCDTDILRQAAPYIDYIMYDIKCLDSDKHKRFTGQGNALILKNLGMLFEEFPKLHKHIRTPVVPDFNDTENDIKTISDFLMGHMNYSYELLVYHRFGEGKYKMLGREYAKIPKKLDEELFKKLKTYEVRE
ncbi:MAG: glycyl-radical enzyme activating protein [Candidatus Ornithomonoglobus sp.]